MTELVKTLSENVGIDFRNQLNGKDYTSFTEMVTPALAEEWLDYRYHHQRPLRYDHVEYLAGLMRRGDWQPGSVINFTIDPKGTINLVNGQHTLHAISKSGATIPLTIVLTAVQDDNEVSRVYSTLDTGIALRNGQDAMSAYDIYALTSLGKERITNSVSGVRLIYLAFNTVNNRRSEMEKFLKFPPNLAPVVIDWAPYATKFFDCIKGGNQEIMNLIRKGSIIGMGMITFRFAPVISNEFWYQVTHDDGISKDDPRKTLSRFILSNPTRSNGGTSLKHPDYAHAIERCWRAYVDGQSLTKILLPRSNEPIAVTRTPYDTRLANLGIGYPKGFER